MIEIAKRVQNKRVYALSGGWTRIGIATKNCKNKRVYALKGGWTITGLAKKVQKIRGFMHEGAGEQYTVNPLYLANLAFFT